MKLSTNTALKLSYFYYFALFLPLLEFVIMKLKQFQNLWSSWKLQRKSKAKKLPNLLERYQNSKKRFMNLAIKFQKSIRYGFKIILILGLNLISSITANCQTDTLSKKQIDSLVSWIAYINTDLRDYDLVKQKLYLQEQQIKGLQAIERKQSDISLRKEIRLSNYSSLILDLQNRNNLLQTDLKAVKKQRNKAIIEVWVWRGSLIIFTTLKLYSWLK